MGLLLAALVGLPLLAAARDAHQQPRVAVVAPAAFEGALVLPSSLEDQTARADLIVVGRVQETASRLAPGGIVTDVRLDVEQYLKGRGWASLTLTVPGGQVGSLRLYVSGAPNFLQGERAESFGGSPQNIAWIPESFINPVPDLTRCVCSDLVSP